MPLLRIVSKGKFELCEPLVETVYTSVGLPFDIIVHKGFVMDLASIPPVMDEIFDPIDPRYTKAAIVHDYLYKEKQFSRSYSDKIFYNLLIKYGASKMTAWLMYGAVRIAGWMFWGR